MIAVGNGPPLVLVPGFQGRWEYLRPAIDALAEKFRVLTFPLSGEPGSDRSVDASLGFENDARQVLSVLDRCGLASAIICGVSFGGLPALRVAAAHPDRTRALVLVSTPGPTWRLRPRHRLYVRAPLLFGPLFFVESPFRLGPEMSAALPDLGARARFAGRQLASFIRRPWSPSRMAARASLVDGVDVGAECAAIRVPTLLVTGEPALDRVVPVDSTLAYLALVANARHRTLHATGHIGLLTRPQAFAAILDEFVSDLSSRQQQDGTCGVPGQAAGPAEPAATGPFHATL